MKNNFDEKTKNILDGVIYKNINNIKVLYDEGKTMREIAELFGVNRITIGRAISGKSWKYLNKTDDRNKDHN